MQNLLEELSSKSGPSSNQWRFMKSCHKNYLYSDPDTEVINIEAAKTDLHTQLSSVGMDSETYNRLLLQFEQYQELSKGFFMTNGFLVVNQSSNRFVYQLDRLDYFLLKLEKFSKLLLQDTEHYLRCSKTFRNILNKDREGYYVSQQDIQDLPSLFDVDDKLRLITSFTEEPSSSISHSKGKFYITLQQDPNYNYVKELCKKSAKSSLVSNMTFLSFCQTMEIFKEYFLT